MRKLISNKVVHVVPSNCVCVFVLERNPIGWSSQQNKQEYYCYQPIQSPFSSFCLLLFQWLPSTHSIYIAHYISHIEKGTGVSEIKYNKIRSIYAT